jgi:hypothetical protein
VLTSTGIQSQRSIIACDRQLTTYRVVKDIGTERREVLEKDSETDAHESAVPVGRASGGAVGRIAGRLRWFVVACGLIRGVQGDSKEFSSSQSHSVEQSLRGSLTTVTHSGMQSLSSHPAAPQQLLAPQQSHRKGNDEQEGNRQCCQ